MSKEENVLYNAIKEIEKSYLNSNKSLSLSDYITCQKLNDELNKEGYFLYNKLAELEDKDISIFSSGKTERYLLLKTDSGDYYNYWLYIENDSIKIRDFKKSQR